MAVATLLFFFSSRRRHTRLQGDWSSDVCSSDLPTYRRCRPSPTAARARRARRGGAPPARGRISSAWWLGGRRATRLPRSEERRVGDESGSSGGEERGREVDGRGNGSDVRAE